MSRLALAIVLVAGITTSASAHVPATCASEYFHLETAREHYAIAVDVLDPALLRQMTKNAVITTVLDFLDASVVEFAATRNLLECISEK